jgi:hypothetical protein
MDTLPLPPRPNLAQYKKRAKDLVTAAKSRDDGAVRAWATEWLETLARLLGLAIIPPLQERLDRTIEAIEERVRDKVGASHATGSKFTLADAQFLIACAHGFENWSEFANHLERTPRNYADGEEFEAAVDALVAGDLPMLESLLRPSRFDSSAIDSGASGHAAALCRG